MQLPHIADVAPTKSSRVTVLLLTVCGLACLAILVTNNRSGFSHARTLETGIGGYEVVPLPDGTILHLNTHTQLTQRTTVQRTTVDPSPLRLLQGEAAFSVSRPRNQPLEIDVAAATLSIAAADLDIRMRESNAFDLLVKEGSVLLQRPNAIPVDVQFGERVRVFANGAVERRALEPGEFAQSLAWTEGRAVFDHQPLSEVVADLNRYQHKPFVIADSSLRDVTVSGTFSVLESQSVLRQLREFGVSRQTRFARDGRIELVRAAAP